MKETLSDRVRLGVFEVDLRAGELRQGEGAVLVLPDQPLQILRMLVEADGEIVTRDEIRQKLWPDDTVVEFDHSINNAIKKLRRALVDSADDPHYIGTIAKRGYRLLVPVERVSVEHDFIESLPHPNPNEGLGRSTHVAVASVGNVGAAARAIPSVQPVVAQSSRALPRSPSRWISLAAAIVVSAVGVAGSLYWRAHRALKLTDRDTIVVSDFENKTGDPVFDDTLKQALTIQLEQSPFLNVLSSRRVRETLKLMSRSAKDPLTDDVTREICLRSGSKAMVVGSIAALGNEYVVGLNAVDCNLGDSLAEVQQRANGKEHVLNALDKASTDLRHKLGESLNSVAKYATPLSEATTPSLEALKAFSMGNKIQFREGATAALPFFRRSVEIDPSFAFAYRSLAIVYGNLNEKQRAVEYASKAYELRAKVSERERFGVEATYYREVTGELEKAAQTYELWQQSYPRDASPPANAGGIYSELGNMDKFLEKTLEALRSEPNNYVIYANLADAYMNLNRLDEAEAAFKAAEQRGLSGEALLQARYQLAFLKNDKSQMAQMAAAAKGKPGVEDWMLATQADTEGWYGRLRNARKLTEEAVNSANRNDATETAANYEAQAALRESTAGNQPQARADAKMALQLSQDRDVKAIAALVLARAGDLVMAERLASDLDKAFPLDTLVQQYWLPTIRGALSLERRDATGAIQVLAGMDTMDLATINAGINVYLCPAYIRGQAYLVLHDGKAAAAEFQKFIDHYGLLTNFPWGALARLGLARAYALEAQTDHSARDKAHTAYQNFLTIWKEADPDIPIYRQAKAEYAKLQ